MAYPGKIDADALALALLAGQSIEQLAKTFGAHERTVRRRISQERAVHGAEWPVKRPIAKTPTKPPVETRAGPGFVRAGITPRQPPPMDTSRTPAPGASADELEDYAQTVLVAESLADDASPARIAAARALVELADKRRARKPRGDEGQVDPAEAAAAVMLEIERATSNVENEVEADQEIDIGRSISDGQGPRPPLQ